MTVVTIRDKEAAKMLVEAEAGFLCSEVWIGINGLEKVFDLLLRLLIA
ncbi:MAG: hypothetical protein WB660_13520 [Candidatus Sulfotelmatobacter sp.]